MPGGTAAIGYDDRGLAVSAAVPGQPAQSYAYDGAGQLTARTDAAGTASFGYDAAGRLSGETDPFTAYGQGLGYDAGGRLTDVWYGWQGDHRALGYDGLGRVTADTLADPTGTTIASAAYGYDPGGNLTSKTTAGYAGAGANSYGYDQANRLTSWTAPSGPATSYGYDGAGNRTSAGGVGYGYNQRDQLTAASTGASYAYAAAGTLASVTSGGGTTSYAFDAYGELASAGSVSYGYDALGRVASRAQAGTTSGFAYDGTSAALSAVLDGSGNLTSGFGRGPAGQLLAVNAGGVKANAVTNSHGDLTGTVTGYGTALSSSAAYGPFGTLAASAGPVAPVGFQGGYTDPATGQVNMWSRWYDPGTGAFTAGDAITQSTGPGTADPATDGGGGAAGAGGDPLAAAAGDPLFPGNPYAYAAGNPLTVTDPTGHCSSWWCGLLVGWSTGAPVLAPTAARIGAAALTSVEVGLVAGLTGGFLIGSASPTASGCWVDVICPVSAPGAPPMLGLEPGWGASPRRGTGPGTGPGTGGDGGYGGQCAAYCAAAAPPRPVCDQACLQAKWVLRNALTPLARPPLKASITQAQLDARRNAAERNVQAQAGKEDLQGVTTAFEGQNAETSTAPGQGGGSGGGVPRAPACMPEGPDQQPGNAAEGIPDASMIVRGGQSEMPGAGEVFSGAHGQSLEEAAAGVPHGTIRSTTAGEIRAGGGSVEYAPEYNERVGATNYQHVNVTLGEENSPFSDPFANPVPRSSRFGGPNYPFGGPDYPCGP